MTTKKEMTKVLYDYTNEILKEGDNFSYIYVDGDVYVSRIGTKDSFGRKSTQYFATTHWAINAIVTVDFESDGTPFLRWSMGGTCEDASAWEIATVMHAIWKDVLGLV